MNEGELALVHWISRLDLGQFHDAYEVEVVIATINLHFDGWPCRPLTNEFYNSSN